MHGTPLVRAALAAGLTLPPLNSGRSSDPDSLPENVTDRGVTVIEGDHTNPYGWTTVPRVHMREFDVAHQIGPKTIHVLLRYSYAGGSDKHNDAHTVLRWGNYVICTDPDDVRGTTIDAADLEMDDYGLDEWFGEDVDENGEETHDYEMGEFQADERAAGVAALDPELSEEFDAGALTRDIESTFGTDTAAYTEQAFRVWCEQHGVDYDSNDDALDALEEIGVSDYEFEGKTYEQACEQFPDEDQIRLVLAMHPNP